jgi:hypothetical protein
LRGEKSVDAPKAPRNVDVWQHAHNAFCDLKMAQSLSPMVIEQCLPFFSYSGAWVVVLEKYGGRLASRRRENGKNNVFSAEFVGEKGTVRCGSQRHSE